MNENFDKDKIAEEIVKKSGGKISKESIKKAKSGDMSALLSSLGEKDRKMLKKALADKETARKILESKEARDIINSFMKGKNNG